jgi:hypothetical protein
LNNARVIEPHRAEPDAGFGATRISGTASINFDRGSAHPLNAPEVGALIHSDLEVPLLPIPLCRSWFHPLSQTLIGATEVTKDTKSWLLEFAGRLAK